ncbi:matrix metalloproteinase-24-like, partial [Frankliniella occidentalis]|uniref:Matrix metalloproteinase-24-like n=1 Tax=Frankliniella occidentalis TaxID=133901 RepID=A0A6J1T6J3_FRAOC
MFLHCALPFLLLVGTGAGPLPPIPDAYWAALGYSPPSLELAVVEHDPAVAALQREFGLPQTGLLDSETVAAARRGRCGVSESSLWRPARSARWALVGSRWRKAVLTYNVTRYHPEVAESRVDAALGQAVAAIQAVSQLRLERVAAGGGPPDIEVRFEEDHHPFCLARFGPGVMAHAWSPDIGGDVHVRLDQDWGAESL